MAGKKTPTARTGKKDAQGRIGGPLLPPVEQPEKAASGWFVQGAHGWLRSRSYSPHARGNILVTLRATYARTLPAGGAEDLPVTFELALAGDEVRVLNFQFRLWVEQGGRDLSERAAQSLLESDNIGRPRVPNTTAEVLALAVMRAFFSNLRALVT
uniref:Uncharacterized protein n=1 Tax=viral metagenome TaxID=1070528 RepID=A0A2V0R9U1_9ZZZZ